MAGMTEVYTSAPYVLIETRSNGVLDVSDDVQNVSVSRRLDAVSTAEVTLNNYATYNTGRYNGIINIGDRAHVSFYVDGQRIQQITGRISRVPIQAFQEGAYKITISDAIGDLQYIYWDPYSQEAQDGFTGPQVFQVQDDIFKYSASGSDNGIGVLINSFLQKVCGFPDGSVKVAKFPDINNVVKNVVDAIIKGDVSDSELESQYQMYFDMIFGAGTSYPNDVAGDSDDNSGESRVDRVEASDSAKAIANMFGASSKDTANDWNTYVSFCKRFDQSTQKNWKEWDQASHTGRYGLTRKQVKDAIGKDCEAWELSDDDQTKAVNFYLNKISKSYKGTGKIVWFYLSGLDLEYDPNSDVITTSWHVMIKGKEQKTKSDWEKTVGYKDSDLEKEGVPKPSSGKSASDSQRSRERDGKSRSGQTRALADQNGDTHAESTTVAKRNGLDAASQAKWDRFIKEHGEGAAPSDPDGGYPGECWDLWLSYFDIITDGARPLPHQNGSNPAYWQSGYDSESLTKQNFIKIGPSSIAQRGDVGFWSNSGSYGHVDIILEDQGDKLVTLDGNWNNAHGPITKNVQGKHSSYGNIVGYLRPKIFEKYAPDGAPTGTMSNASGGSSGSSGSSSSSDPIRSTAFALFKYVSFWDQNKTIESQMLGGELALKNDQPAFDYLKTLCNASFRSFMSMPDGSIAAFVPDYFGFINQDGGTPNQIDIPMVEVINFNSYFDKSSYVSHYYLLTNEISGNPMNAGPGSSINDSSMFSKFGNVIRSQNSSGTMTLENAKKADAIFKLMNAENISGCSNAQEMLQKWGVSVKNEENDLIVDHTLTALYALFQFLKFWANCFTSSLSITFKPEIIPGLRVRIPDAGTTLFVKSVTHSWDASSGGRTTISTVCPVTDSGLIGIEKK